jgi:hypothetical protein
VSKSIAPAFKLGDKDVISKVYRWGDKLMMLIEDSEYAIRHNLATKETQLCFVREIPEGWETRKIFLKDELDSLPQYIRDIVIFNLDLFS